MLSDGPEPKFGPVISGWNGGIYDRCAPASANPTSTSPLSKACAGAIAGLSCRLMYAYTEIPALISVGEKWDAVSSVSLGSQRALFKRCFRSDVMNLASESSADCTLTSMSEYDLIALIKVSSDEYLPSRGLSLVGYFFKCDTLASQFFDFAIRNCLENI
jgi:hypothetical protein